MKLIVCISHVSDTTTKVKFTENNTQLDENGIQWIINPWDELALTRAVEMMEDANSPVDAVEVVTVGSSAVEPTLRKCLAIGAQKAYRIDALPKDAYTTAFELSEFIQAQSFDMVICGIESSDYNNSSVGGMLAEFLEAPSISSVSNINFTDGKAQIQRDIATGREIINVTGLAVLIAHKGFAAVPRIPNMRGIMTARKKPLEVIPAKNTQVLTEYLNFEFPEQKSAVKMIDAENVAELVELLSSEAKAI